nr:RteC domain-containing protein [Draconibacterium sediminis]
MLSKVFNIKLGDIFHVFLDIRNRKNERTKYLDKLSKILLKKMDELDEM